MSKIAYVTVDRATGAVTQWGRCDETLLGHMCGPGQVAIARTDTDPRPPATIDPATLPPG